MHNAQCIIKTMKRLSEANVSLSRNPGLKPGVSA